MKIYTGYFARTKQYERAGLFPVSIARWTPKWFEGFREVSLAPPADLLNACKSDTPPSDEEYDKRYLASLSPDKVRQALYRIKNAADDKDAVLLCYEKPSDACHRHILADYIKQNLRVLVEEFDVEKWKDMQEEDLGLD